MYIVEEGIPLKEFTLKGYTIRLSQRIDNIIIGYVYTSDGRQLDWLILRDNENEDPVSAITHYVNQYIFTDEELISPCSTMAEYARREMFITAIYPRQYDTMRTNYYSVTNPSRFDCYGMTLYDPVCMEYTYPSNREFVDKHIWLYREFKKTMKPSVFPDIESIPTKEERFLCCLNCIPFAEPDDPYLGQALDYVRSHARDMVKKSYEYGDTELTMKLIADGYIKKPTLKKLLEMANEKEDTQLAALILEQLKDTKQSKSKFDL